MCHRRDQYDVECYIFLPYDVYWAARSIFSFSLAFSFDTA